MDEWADKVTVWINHNGVKRLANNFRLKLAGSESITSCYLFGLSREAARMQGFGFETLSESLVISNWPQFVRTRFELGPAEKVFCELHQTLKNKMREPVIIDPLSVTIQISKYSVTFDGLWNQYE